MSQSRVRILIVFLASLGALFFFVDPTLALNPGQYFARIPSSGKYLEVFLEFTSEGRFVYSESSPDGDTVHYDGSYSLSGPLLELTLEEDETNQAQMTRRFLYKERAGCLILAAYDSSNIYSFAVLPVVTDKSVCYLKTENGENASIVGTFIGSYELPSGETHNISFTIKPEGRFRYREFKKPGRRSIVGISGKWTVENGTLKLTSNNGRRCSKFEFELSTDSMGLKKLQFDKAPLGLKPKEDGGEFVYSRDPDTGIRSTVLHRSYGLQGNWEFVFTNQQLTQTRCVLELKEGGLFHYTEWLDREPEPRMHQQGSYVIRENVLRLTRDSDHRTREFRFGIGDDGRTLTIIPETADNRFRFSIVPVLMDWQAEYQRVINVSPTTKKFSDTRELSDSK